MSLPELDRLLVENIGHIERAVVRIPEIESIVFNALGEKARKWAQKKGWASDMEYSQGDKWKDWKKWLAPEEWRNSKATWDDAFYGWFKLRVGAGDTGKGLPGEDQYYLTRLCQAGVGQIGFVFEQEVLEPARWKKAFASLTGLVSDTGFVAEASKSFFMPFALDPAVLAQALADEDPEAALGPFEAALDALAAARPHFDRLIQQLRPPGDR